MYYFIDDVVMGIDNVVLTISDLRERWCVTLKNRGWSKRPEVQKSRGSSLAVGINLQKDSDPPPFLGLEGLWGLEGE